MVTTLVVRNALTRFSKIFLSLAKIDAKHRNINCVDIKFAFVFHNKTHTSCISVNLIFHMFCEFVRKCRKPCAGLCHFSFFLFKFKYSLLVTVERGFSPDIDKRFCCFFWLLFARSSTLDTRGGGLPADGVGSPIPEVRPGVGKPEGAGIPLPGVGKLDLGIPPDVGIDFGV